MANTYTQCHIHLVFAVKNREALIRPEWKNDLEKYITGIIQNHRHKLLAIGSRPDHIHIFFGYNVNQLIPDLVEEIKTSTNAWIKQNKFSKSRFEWQKWYGAFTHSHGQLDNVVKYILNQDQHHHKKSFKEEYLEMLNKNEIKFKENFLFDFFCGIKSFRIFAKYELLFYVQENFSDLYREQLPQPDGRRVPEIVRQYPAYFFRRNPSRRKSQSQRSESDEGDRYRYQSSRPGIG